MQRQFANSLKIVAGSLFLLLLALATSGILTFSALERAQRDILSGTFELAGREGAEQVESGLRFGRPLAQFLGLEEILQEIRGDATGIDDVLAALPDGTIVGSLQDDWPAALSDSIATRFASGEMSAESTAALSIDATRYFLTPVLDRNGAVAGAIVVGVAESVLEERLDSSIQGSIAFMIAVTAIAAVLLAIVAGRLRARADQPQTSRWRTLLVPLIVLLGAQAAYSFDVLRIFQNNYASATSAAAERLGDSVHDDLAQLLGLGLSLERLPGLDERLQRVISVSDAVRGISIVDPDGTVRHAAERQPDSVSPLAASILGHPVDDIIRPLTGADGEIVGEVRVTVDETVVVDQMANQVINIVTVVVTSAFFMIELFILLDILLRRSAPSVPALERVGPRHIIARPVMFGFIFTWALPLSFVPLKMRTLGESLFGLPPDIVLALPISAEMGCALLTAVVAGRIADRVGWFRPFLVGLLISALGGITAALATDSLVFILARGLTGLGYGLSWMGIQAFVIRYCPSESRGRALANLMAGIFAGFICGTAVGGVLAEQFGYEFVLLASGLMVVVPLALGWGVLREFIIGPQKWDLAEYTRTASGGGSAFAGWNRLLLSPQYLGALILSVVPFSIAQVGLLYFAVPLYLSEIGSSQADIGRILMVYGIVIILFGPMISTYIDRRENKVPFIVLGGLIGGAGLGVLFLDGSMLSMLVAVSFLGLSSSMAEPARSSFILNLKVVKEFGVSSAIGLQRAADKLGQMLGPLLIAATFTSFGMERRVALIGFAFAAASILFAVVAVLRSQRSPVTADDDARPEPPATAPVSTPVSTPARDG
ncbi:MFS transporter [Fodinicurvata sp. EGI_FJ10296]|uniref:MFS transporter n=1 Tax=Fodinicurvata sp. EGI_FJ10296 TaxID=3231908 RepID=UPI0034564C61